MECVAKKFRAYVESTYDVVQWPEKDRMGWVEWLGFFYFDEANQTAGLGLYELQLLFSFWLAEQKFAASAFDALTGKDPHAHNCLCRHLPFLCAHGPWEPSGRGPRAIREAVAAIPVRRGNPAQERGQTNPFARRGLRENFPDYDAWRMTLMRRLNPSGSPLRRPWLRTGAHLPRFFQPLAATRARSPLRARSPPTRRR